MNRKACSELAEVTLRRKGLITLSLIIILFNLCEKVSALAVNISG
jgi:hypothetical protein